MRKDVSLGNIHTQMSESYFLGVLLAVAGGFLDAYTYATRGGVFANAQTGNVVLFAIHLAQGQLGSLLRYLIPIAAFALGVVVAEAVRDLFRPQTLLHWRQVLVAIEFLILLASAFIPQGSYDEVVNVAVSFVCALQVETFRKIQGNALATTMCTGNLRSGTDLLYHALRNQDPALLRRGLQYYGIILSFVLGAVIGVWASAWLGAHSVLLCCGLLLAVFIAMFFNRDSAAL